MIRSLQHFSLKTSKVSTAKFLGFWVGILIAINALEVFKGGLIVILPTLLLRVPFYLPPSLILFTIAGRLWWLGQQHREAPKQSRYRLAATAILFGWTAFVFLYF